MKKLIPTIAMTLLGASLLGTSSFAWFSANTSASAEGLSIKAQADSSLLISNAENGTYGAKASLEEKNTVSEKIAPVTRGKASGTASTTSVDFKKIDDTTKGHVLSDGSIETTHTATYVDTTGDYVKSLVYLLYSGQTTPATIEAKCTLANSDPKDSYFEAVKVALYNAGTTTLACEFDFTGSTLGTAVAGTADLSIAKDTKTGYDVYVWVEGTHAACKNANAVNGDTYGVTLSFNLKSEK